MTLELAIGLAVLLPLLGAIGVSLTGFSPNLREAVTLVTSVFTFLLVASIYRSVSAGAEPELVLFTVMPGVDLAFKLEPLGMLYALVASGLWMPTSLYAIGYMRGHNEQNQTRFFVCFALAIFAALGIAFSKNVFTLFLFYEVLTFSTYPLVTHYGNEEAKRAGRVYMGILLTTSVAFLLFAVVLTQGFAGTLDFTQGGILSGKVDGLTVPLLLALAGTGKAASCHSSLATAGAPLR